MTDPAATSASRDPESVSSSGLPPRTAAALAYVAGPVSGGLILLAESHNADVRFHAFQSIIALGALVALIVLGYVLAVASLFVSAGAVALFVRFSTAIWIALLVIAGLCIWKASRGGRWKLPLAGDWAERAAGRG
jgi:uncharacterized membrane protein